MDEPVLSLRVPSLLPFVRAQGVVCTEELLAWGKFLTLGVYALVVIYIVLEAMLRLPQSVFVTTLTTVFPPPSCHRTTFCRSMAVRNTAENVELSDILGWCLEIEHRTRQSGM